MSTADGIEPFEGDDRQYSPTRLPGWLQEVNGPAAPSLARFTRTQLADLSPRDLLVHNDNREVWHANIGPIDTPQLLALHDALEEIVESNRQDGDKTKPAALVDAYPGSARARRCGTTAASCSASRSPCAERPHRAGDRRVPVIYIALSGNTQIKGLNAAICRFYGLPDVRERRRPGRAGRRRCAVHEDSRHHHRRHPLPRRSELQLGPHGEPIEVPGERLPGHPDLRRRRCPQRGVLREGFSGKRPSPSSDAAPPR